MTPQVSLAIPADLHERLWAHLFPGDGDEHGAVILAGSAPGRHGLRLLGREVLLAEDGIDYVPGERGHRALTTGFVQRAALQARDRGLAYLAVHCHGGQDRVSFSPTDLVSHERGYPALRDITAQTVGGLVAAKSALAGDIWLPDGSRHPLHTTVVPGRQILRLYPRPPAPPPATAPGWDRQLRMFGDRGQTLLQDTTVTIVGLGGLGSLLAEMLGRLGVGAFVLIDPERVDPTNLPRLIAARRLDGLTQIRSARAPRWLQHRTERWASPKVRIAARNIRRANPQAKIHSLMADVADPAAAIAATTSDYLFLAADSHTARHVTNAIAQQYLIPGVQAGVKVTTNDDGEVVDIHTAVRPLTPGQACLWCAGLIDSSELAIEALPDAERRHARYVPEIAAPSVITLNGIAASEAATFFLFALTGLSDRSAPTKAMLRFPRGTNLRAQTITPAPACRWCSPSPMSNLGAGQSRPLPTRATHR